MRMYRTRRVLIGVLVGLWIGYVAAITIVAAIRYNRNAGVFRRADATPPAAMPALAQEHRWP